MQIIKLLVMAVCLGFMPLAHAEALNSVGSSKPETLDELLLQVKALHGEEGRRNQQREQRFLASKNQQRKILNDAEKKLAEIEAESERLKLAFEANEKQLMELSETLHQRTGTLGEMFGVVRQSAGDLRAVIDSSLVSTQFEDRSASLEKLANSKALPTVIELENLWYTLQQEMTESGKVVRYNADVVSASGVIESQSVVRIGPFNAVAEGQFLNFLPETKQLMVLPRQPGQPHQDFADAISSTEASGRLTMTIDTTRGSILGMLVQSPSALERVQQGGVIGYIILGLGLLGVLIALERLVRLFLMGKQINQQLSKPDQPCDKNPLGRVLTVFSENKDADPETLELRLDEAILKETPAINRGARIVKLLAAIAPLLGLLGTVTGMIGTFQAITLFGTGDPKLMAGGISQALVTTMLGLIVAVPLLFMHAGIAARSQRFIQVLDEQTAGLIARQLESK
ncbi:MAG: MotA/TolQ/ExbB proton channel family protein [Pseudomonadales bacterium]|nr:MotA/TolQ/ExbB proton channel family protein [Pseudomonadales bacterium]